MRLSPFPALGAFVALTLLLALTGCAHDERPPAAALTRLRSADAPEGALLGSKDGTPPRAATAARAPHDPEDTSKKSASLETAGYTDSDHVRIFTPAITGTIENVVDGATLSGSYLVDVVSAASVDILSTASKQWHEVRHAGTISGRYKPHDLGVGFSASVSNEPDYLSYGASGNLSYDLDEKNTSLFFGYGYGHDTVGRGSTPFTTFARSVQRGNFLLGLDQVMGRATLASLAFSAIIENGDQSKPYRYIPMFTAAEAAEVPNGASIDYVNAHRLSERPLEQLPLARRRFSLTGSLAQRFEASTLRGSERAYVDDWGVKASTTDARWLFDAGDRLLLWPHARFHAQTPVSFWQRAYVSDDQPGFSLPEFRTGDRELGPLWAVTGGGGTQIFLGGAAHPRFFSVVVEGDVAYTKYTDDIYITARTGFLGTITLQLEEP